MSFWKRLRVMWAAAYQEWHEKRCPECGETWWQEGRDNALVRACPTCDAKDFDDYLCRLERKFDAWRKEGAI